MALHYAIGGARFVKHSLLGIKTGKALVEETKKFPVFADYDLYEETFDYVILKENGCINYDIIYKMALNASNSLLSQTKLKAIYESFII